MGTLLELADEMDALAAKVAAFPNRVAKEVALTVLTDLVQVTPADVGTAISNWQITLDEPAIGILGAWEPSPRGRMKAGVWTHAVDPVVTAQANVAPTLAFAKTILALKQPGQTIYITNNLPYIRELDEGSSEQAPAGYVDRAVILGGEAVSRAKL